MMNRLLNVIAVFSTAILSCVSCSGNVDPEQEEDNVVPEGVLRIFADKTEISADGNDEVTFTVMFGSQDVSNEKTLQLIRIFNGDEKYMAYGANKFTTVTPGKYTFKAKYYYGGNHVTDNEVEIDAEQFFSGEEQEYERRYLGILFTSTGCNSCPLAADGLKKLQAEYPGEISLVAFHADMDIPDPMTIQETYDFKNALGGKSGLPAFYWNMNKETYTGGATFTDGFSALKQSYETFCGVKLSSDYDDQTRELKLQIGITSNNPVIFRYIAFLVEDNIPATGDYEQNGRGEDYIHNNVVRKVITSAVTGDKLNNGLPLTVGVESRIEKTLVLDSTWKPENMRVVVAAMASDDGGYNWIANNVNECKVK